MKNSQLTIQNPPNENVDYRNVVCARRDCWNVTYWTVNDVSMADLTAEPEPLKAASSLLSSIIS